SIFKLQFSNGDSIEVTGTHPIYSLDRKGFIPVSEITTGEKLLTMNGFVEVGKTTESDEKQQVYNLEVGQWHNFLVGGSGVVVHNYCFPFAKDPSAAFNEIKIKWGYKMTANEMKELNNAISRVKLKDTSIFPFDDGKIFQNSVLKSPTAQRLNTGETYREWTVKTPGISNRGERRIVVGNKTNRAYYTHDHYDDFIEIDLTGWK
ncbi:MAG: ribonuclease domain-containing protein, partial [Saprospiraceae bacterium]